jgi:hypothetical protein
MDPLLRAALDASIGWYEDLCSLHGVATTMHHGLWSSVTAPPPLHSDAVVVEPHVTADHVVDRLRGRLTAGVKDSFATLDLQRHGMRLLFEAWWLHRPPATSTALPAAWSVVQTEPDLAAWTAQHDTTDVLLPGILRRAHFLIVARCVDDQIVAGAVLRLGTGVVDVSNVHSVEGHTVDWEEIAAVAAHHFPDRPLVGYERGSALTAAVGAGFAVQGPLRVFVRDAATPL